MASSERNFTALNVHEPLLSGLKLKRQRPTWRYCSRRFIAFAVLAFVVTLCCVFAIISLFSRNNAERRNIIMMVSDGFGPASETFGRTMYQHIHSASFDKTMPLDDILVGSSRTQSNSSLVTDSAAGATAFSCHRKTYNGAISVDINKKPCGTVMEAAHKKGWKTGLVVTSRITHATNDIAEQQIGDLPIGITADLMFGGGRRHFVPKEDPESVRMDNRSLIDEAVTSGFRVVTRRAGFDQLQEDSSLPILALLTPDHMSYEIDRDSAQEPSLKEMAQKALSILDYASKNDKNSPGFFLMIEGSRIDMAAHSNDPGAHAREILMYYEVIKLVKQFVKENPDTAMVSTSDHETGGLALARQVSEAYPEYLWKPDQILKQKKSTFTLASQLLAHTVMSSDNEDAANQQRKFVQETIIRGGLGLTDPTEDEFAYLLDTKRTVGQLDYFMGNMASLRGQIGWSTHGHTGVDVNLYAYGRDTNQLHGNRENTEVGAFLASYLDLDKDMDDITEDLKKHEFFKHPDIPILRTRRHHNDESIH